jgi:hypothetical protein
MATGRAAFVAAACVLGMAAWLLWPASARVPAPSSPGVLVRPSTAPDGSTGTRVIPEEQVSGELWLDASTRAPAGIEVRLSRKDAWDEDKVGPDGAPAFVQGVLTRGQGVFGFSGVDAGDYVLWSRPAGRPPALATLTARNEKVTEVRLVCGPGAQVVGTVAEQESKERLVGVDLWGTSHGLPFAWHARTNAQGEFVLDGVPAGKPFTLHAQEENHLDWEDTFKPQAVEIEMHAAAVVHGDVTLDGKPQPGAEVVLWNMVNHTRRAKKTSTDLRGHYAFTGVGVGPVDVRAEWEHTAGSGQATTVAGTRSRVDLDLVARFPVQVEVRSGWGEPLTGARVSLGYCVRPSGKMAPTQNVTVLTDDAGHAELWMDDRGTCVLSFEHENHGGETTRTVMAPNVPVTLQFAKSVLVRGRVTTTEGNGVAAVVTLACDGDDHATATAREDGRFAVRQLGASVCDVTVNADGWSTKRVKVALSLERPVVALNVVVDDRGLMLAGRVLDADGKGVAAEVRLIESSEEGLRYFNTLAPADGRFTLTGLQQCTTCSHILTASPLQDPAGRGGTQERPLPSVRAQVTPGSTEVVLVMPALDAGPSGGALQPDTDTGEER